MKSKLTLALIFLMNIIITSAQSVTDDLSVTYMKANVLFDQGRYDEAVRMYNLILKQDENHANALFMRAKAKYELGAYKGTKLDGVKYVELHGITKNLIKVMGQAEFKLGNIVAAYNHAKTAVELDPYDAKMQYLLGETALEYSNQNEACEAFAQAAFLGDSKASRAVNQICGGASKWLEKQQHKLEETNPAEGPQSSEKIEQNEDPKSSKEENKSSTESNVGEDNGDVTLQDILELENEKVELPDTNDESNVPAAEEVEQDKEEKAEENSGEVTQIDIKIPDAVDMDATQDIIIDEKLTLTIFNGLGDRAVEDQPNIFMLSDQDGIVVIDICVNRTGRVTEASFNRNESTILRSSMTSLALRKAKEFLFEASGRAEQCGSMIYRIKS